MGQASATSSVRVAAGLGSSEGDSAGTIRRACEELRRAGLREITISPLYRTAPVNCEPGTPEFVNAAVTGCWAASPREFLERCQAIERALGRPARHSSRRSRPIDIDILLWDDGTVQTDRLTVPHPRLRERLFVLVPLADIAPDWPVPPDRETVAVLRDRLLARTGRNGWGERLTR